MTDQRLQSTSIRPVPQWDPRPAEGWEPCWDVDEERTSCSHRDPLPAYNTSSYRTTFTETTMLRALNKQIKRLLFSVARRYASAVYYYGRPMEWGRPLYFHPVVCSSFFLFFFFSSPNLSRRRVDVCHTCTRCGLSANLRCRSETCCTRLAEIQDSKSRQKSPTGHHRTTLSGYIFATTARIDNRKTRTHQEMRLRTWTFVRRQHTYVHSEPQKSWQFIFDYNFGWS